jgi:hypothetical protein
MMTGRRHVENAARKRRGSADDLTQIRRELRVAGAV